MLQAAPIGSTEVDTLASMAPEINFYTNSILGFAFEDTERRP